MKMNHNNQHLNFDELIQNLVDPTDLASERQAHMLDCPRCRHEAESLRQRYQRLGRMARKLAPTPTHSFRLPDAIGTRRHRSFKPVLAMGMVAALILVFTVFWPRVFDTHQSHQQTAMVGAEKDSQLMAQVDALVDDALPKPYQRLLAASEPELTEDVIDWIVPPIDGDSSDHKPQA
jgi:anti-sigma factor RsiW